MHYRNVEFAVPYAVLHIYVCSPRGVENLGRRQKQVPRTNGFKHVPVVEDQGTPACRDEDLNVKRSMLGRGLELSGLTGMEDIFLGWG